VVLVVCVPEREAAMLAGYRMLVVQDEALVAESVAALLTAAEGVSVGPAATIRHARQLIKDSPALDAALLDVNLSDGSVTPVLEALSARGVPTLLYTGGPVPEQVRQRHPDLIALSKPVQPARLIGELRKVIDRSARAKR
jgi:DNA-binding response OmpR family regulator